jgi:hypothetical protein
MLQRSLNALLDQLCGFLLVELLFIRKLFEQFLGHRSRFQLICHPARPLRHILQLSLRCHPVELGRRLRVTYCIISMRKFGQVLNQRNRFLLIDCCTFLVEFQDSPRLLEHAVTQTFFVNFAQNSLANELCLGHRDFILR